MPYSSIKKINIVKVNLSIITKLITILVCELKTSSLKGKQNLIKCVNLLVT